jgi:hypothetical protein
MPRLMREIEEDGAHRMDAGRRTAKRLEFRVAHQRPTRTSLGRDRESPKRILHEGRSPIYVSDCRAPIQDR